MRKELLDRIVVNPKVMLGKPIIRGTRIPVDMIVKLIAQGMKIEDILDDYPNLTKDDIKAALLYSAEVVSGDIKENKGVINFLTRSLETVKTEFNLVCIAHNISRL